MATVIETLVTRLGFDYDPKGLKKHDADVKQSTKSLAKAEAQGKGWSAAMARAGTVAAQALMPVAMTVRTVGLGLMRLGRVSTRVLTRMAGLAMRATKAVASLGMAAARKLAPAFAAVAAAVPAAMAAFTVKSIGAFASAGDEIAKTAQKIGVTTDELQEMRFAAERSGASQEALSVAIKTLNRQMLDASKTGKGPLVDALSEIGLSVKDVAGLSSQQMMSVFAERLNTIQDPARKSALAMKIFGEQGTALIPMLNQGSAGLRGLYAVARQQPNFLSPEQTASAERLNDALGDLRGSLKGAAQQVGAGLAPAVIEVVEYITTWIRENQTFIRQDLPKVLGGITAAAGALVKQIAFAVDEWKFLIAEGKRWADWAEETLPGIGGAIESAFNAVISPLETVGSLVGSVVDKIDAMAASLGIIENKARGLGSWLGIGNEERTNVRGVGFVGETEERRAARLAQLPPAQIARLLVDPNTSPDDRKAAARAMGDSADRTRRYKQQVDSFVGASQSLADRASSMFVGVAGSFAAADAPSERKRGRGVGGSSKKDEAKETGPSIDELIDRLGKDGASMRDVLDAARTGMPTGRQTPLQGAQIVRIDASYNATTNVTVELPMAAVQEGAERATEKAADMIKTVLDERDRRAFSHYESAVRI